MPPRKLILAYVDSLRTETLREAAAAGAAPTLAALLARGSLVGECVSSFPSVTPVACAELATGADAERHWISGMNWYHRLERRYVEYGSSLDASRAVGIFRALYDLVYNMNLAHLNPGLPTIFERLDDAGLRTAATPFLIYRGRHRHQVSLEGLMRRAIEAGRLKFRHHTWGPRELFYGDLYASREVPCKATSIPGARDGYAACCAAELVREGAADFILLSLPDHDHRTHRDGPAGGLDSLAQVDGHLATVAEAAGGIDGLLAEYALILVADHAHSGVDRGLPLADLMALEWRLLRPSADRPGDAQVAVSPTGRAASVYLLPGEDPADGDAVAEWLAAVEGVDLVCWLEHRGRRLVREEPGPPPPDATVVVARRSGRLRFAPGGGQRDLRGRGWRCDGDLSVLDLEPTGDAIDSRTYPDALGRLHAALAAPHAGDLLVSLAPGFEAVDWGGISHAGGASHGALHRDDSLAPLLMVNCGPSDTSEKKQWALTDIAPLIYEHFEIE